MPLGIVALLLLIALILTAFSWAGKVPVQAALIFVIVAELVLCYPR